MNRIFILAGLLLATLVGCTTQGAILPLADDRPTVLFFYTDG